jgi:hypothetical protein
VAVAAAQVILRPVPVVQQEQVVVQVAVQVADMLPLDQVVV